MPFENIIQPEIVFLTENLRLKKYAGEYEKALAGYQDPYVYQNSEGIFDDAKKPDLDYVRGMFTWLDAHGELYFIEALENDWRAIGDVTVKPENPPIAIWYDQYRGRGIGTLVMQAVIGRLKELGYEKITGSTVYKWNDRSLKMHERLGFSITEEDEREYTLERRLK
ncbi:MAG: GNAT family N-acetyltransferase [Oscillospiraceae bacterium]|nr:GNAT family N-acetyltransferase [Oscillospiraceae bacterium]